MRSLFLAATALTFLGGAAFAQSVSTSGSAANATNSSGSRSSAVANPTINVVGSTSSSRSGANVTASTQSGASSRSVTNIVIDSSRGNAAGAAGTNASSAAGDPTIHYTGGYTVRNTPELVPPSVNGGNPCAVGAAGGVALPGFGVSLGGTWADRACERRQQSALLFNMGEQKVALELMCQDENVRAAMKVAGKPCTADTQAAQAVGTPPPMLAASDAAPAPSGVRIGGRRWALN